MIEHDTIRSVLDAYLEALNRRDRSAFVMLFAERAEQHDLVGEPPHVGRAEIGVWWDRAMTEWDQFEISARESYIAGNQVVDTSQTFAFETTRAPPQ